MKKFYSIFWLFMAVATAMIGHSIHHSIFWCILDFIFWPFTWIKWLVLHQVNISIIKAAFSFFLN